MNIICIISYFNISPFFEHYYSCTIYAIILIILHRTAEYFTLYFSCYSQCNCNSQYRYNYGYLGLSFDSITYFFKNTGEHCVFVINIHTCKCTLLLWEPPQFYLLRLYNIQNNIGWLFLIVLHFSTGLCEIVKFLINTVITVTYFIRSQHCVLVISIVTCKYAIPILKILRFGICHRY